MRKGNMKTIAISILCCFTFLHAQVTYNQEFQINTSTEYDQCFPSVTSLKDSGFVVCWYSYYGIESTDIFCQIFNNDGSKRGQEFIVNTYTKSWQEDPCVTGLNKSSFVVCWESYKQDESLTGVFGQIFKSNGVKFNDEFLVNTYTENSQLSPVITNLTNGGFAVCWVSMDQALRNSCEIYGQLFNYDGSKSGSEFQINTTVQGGQSAPSISSLIDGKFIICWISTDQDGSDTGIFGQLYYNVGRRQGNEFQINTYTDNNQMFPIVSGLSNGGFVVCWESWEQDGNGIGVFAQTFDMAGNKYGNEFQINTYTLDHQMQPYVSGLSNGKFIVTWVSSNQDGSDLGIYGQMFKNDGTRFGTEFQVNDYIYSRQTRPRISSFAEDRFIICWESRYQDGSNTGIYGKYYLIEPIIHYLNVFSILEPAHDATTNNISPTFKWHATNTLRINFPWELEYKIYLDDNNDFMHPQIISGIYDTTCVVDSLIPGTTYFWKVLAKNVEGDSLWSSETNAFFVSHDATSIEYPESSNPKDFRLFANYPNPFNPETTIKYALPADQSFYQVKVKIYDALGQLITTLIDEQQNPGLHTLVWKGQNAAGQAVPSGIYFCVVEAGAFKATQKMLLVR